MGCGSSKPAEPPPAAAAPVPQAPTGGGGGGGGGKGGGKGKKGKGKGDKKGKFQIKLSGNWQDYDDVEDRVLKRAFLIGQPSARFHLRGNDYEYNFKRMKQKNLKSNAEREIRPPRGLKRPPAPLVPPGATVIVTVRAGQAGQQIEIPDPNNKGQMIKVNVPAGARPGQKMAVPVPEKGQSVEDVCKKQQGWSTGAKTAAGLAAVGVVGAAAVGGALVGDHLAGGSMAADGAAAAADMATDVATDAADAAADWAPGAADAAGDWAEGAADDAGDWGEGAIDDIGDFAEDAGDWLGDAAEDAGDWVMSLF
jgi:hypothetical protein